MVSGTTQVQSGYKTGKGAGDENFPVASRLVHPRHRAPILAFYAFARAADDVADHPVANSDEKLKVLEAMRRSLVGEEESVAEAVKLRAVLADRSMSPEHPLDLLEAFRRDAVKTRYADWDELLEYCRYSAMPVGRFVLDVHGEARDLWPLNDALCAALQIINHLQDCAKDYRNLDRVYLPQDLLAAHHAPADALAGHIASPGLLAAIREAAARTGVLLENAAPFAGTIGDKRLGLEVAVIQRLAEDLNARLKTRDPLSQSVHHTKWEALSFAGLGVMGFIGARLFAKKAPANLANG